MSKQDMSKNLTSINSLCTLIEFNGENAIGFLNNLLLSDLTTFVPNQLYYSALCNPKGRIISSVFISIKNHNHIFIFCPQNMSCQLLSFFNMRKFRLKISITIANNLDCLTSEFFANSLYGTLTTDLPEDFYLTLFKNNLPWIDANTSEKFIPQHVNLDQHDDIMSFTKGCYPGQEIIARLKYLGKVKKRMKLLTAKSKAELQQNNKLISPIIEVSDTCFQTQVLSNESTS